MPFTRCWTTWGCFAEGAVCDGYRPSPLALRTLSRFYDIPEKRLLVLAGAVRDVPQAFCEQASRFAAQSESFANLTAEEKRALDEFMRVLKSDS